MQVAGEMLTVVRQGLNVMIDDSTLMLPLTVQPVGAPNGGVKDEEKEKLRREKQGRRLQEINCKKQQEKVLLRKRKFCR